MTTSPHADLPDKKSLRARSAFRVALIMVVVTLAVAVFAFSSAPARSEPQAIAYTLPIALGAIAAVCAWLSRRGRSELGMQLLIGAFLLAGLAVSIVTSGLGLLISVGAFVITAAIAASTLPSRSAIRLTSVSVYVSVAILLLDVFGPPGRYAVSPVARSVALIPLSVMLVVYGVFVVRQFPRYSLRAKLILAFLAVTLVPLGLFGLVNDLVTRTTRADEANRALLTAASQTVDSLDAFLESNLQSVRLESQLLLWSRYLSLPADQRSASDLEAEVENTLRILSRRGQIATYIPSYALLDRQGRAVVDTQAAGVGEDVSDEEYFAAPLQTRQPHVSPVLFAGTGGGASLYFTAPVFDAAGEIAGVLRMRYPAGILQELALQQNERAGAQSFVVVFDENAIHLAHGTAPDTLFKLVGPADATRVAELQAARRLPVRSSIAELSTNLPDLEQQLANAATQPFFTAEDVATGDRVNQVAVTTMRTQPWLVAFFQPQDVLLAPVEEQTRNVLVLGLVLTVVVAVAAIGVAHLLASPIVRLTTVARKVSAGDLTAEAPLESFDEIGALADSFNGMTAQLRGLIDSLELRVEARTTQLQASAEVGRAAASILDPDQLLGAVVNLITDRFGFYYAAVFTLDAEGQFAVLREATGEAGRILKARGHQLEVGGLSMVGYATGQRQPRIALDVGEEAVRFANPLLPDTRSEIALPLVVGERMLGALDVQSTQASAFDEARAAVLQAMADQIAIALNNAAVYTESQNNIRTLNGLLEMSRAIAGSRSLDDLRTHALKYIKTIVGIDNYYVALTDEAQTEIRFIVQERPGLDSVDVITRSFGAGRTEHVIRTRQILRMSAAEAATRMAQLGLKTWEQQPGAFLGVPIIVGERVVGMIGLQNFAPGAAFDDLQERFTVALANQLGATLDNLRLAEKTQHALADLDAANRRLTGQAWERFVKASGALAGEWRAGEWVSQREGGVSPTPNLHPAQPSSYLSAPASSLKLPVRVRGQTIGEFDLTPIGEQPDWTPDDLAFARSLVDQVGQALEAARLLEETERLARRDRAINQINSRVRQTIDMDNILKTAVDELGRSLGAIRVFARIGSPDASTLAADDTRHGAAPMENGKDDDHV